MNILAVDTAGKTAGVQNVCLVHAAQLFAALACGLKADAADALDLVLRVGQDVYKRQARRESKNEPSPSRLRRATSPEGRGFMHHQKRRYDKSSPLGGAGIEQSEMTERVKTSLFRSTVSENIRSFTISH